MKKYELVHTAICCPDYFSGDSRPWLCANAYPMKLEELKEELHAELSSGALGGNMPWQERESEDTYKAFHAAIDDLSLNGSLPADHILFADIEQPGEYCYDFVYAYFVFIEIDN